MRAYDGYVLTLSPDYIPNFTDSVPVEHTMQNKIKSLPKGITYSGKLFLVRISYNKKQYKKGPFTDLTDAIKAVDEINQEILTSQSQPIVEYDDNKNPIVKLINKNGDVLGVCLLDDRVWTLVSPYTWCLDKSNGYAYATVSKHIVKMHKFVAEHFLEHPGGKVVIDHINRNKLDNRVCNLRYVSQAQNAQNKSNNKGIRPSITPGKYVASIRSKYIGTFNSRLEAALAYNNKAIEIYGDGAALNDLTLL